MCLLHTWTAYCTSRPACFLLTQVQGLLLAAPALWTPTDLTLLRESEAPPSYHHHPWLLLPVPNPLPSRMRATVPSSGPRTRWSMLPRLEMLGHKCKAACLGPSSPLWAGAQAYCIQSTALLRNVGSGP